MGIYDREYLRDETRPGLFAVEPVTRGLIALCVAVWLAQLLTSGTRGGGPSAFSVTYWLALSWDGLATGQIWRLVTYAVCHDPTNIFHILFNMWFLWIFGRGVESLRGERETVWFYAVSGLAGGLGALLLELLRPGGGGVIGASGIVMSVVTYYALTYPRQEILFFFFPVQMRYLLAFYAALNLIPLAFELAGGRSGSNVSHAAHVGGLAFGFFYQRQDWRLEYLWDGRPDWLNLPTFGKRRGGLKIHRPAAVEPEERTDELADRVDEILEKISREGEASLSDKERGVLEEASRRYRK